MSQEVKKYPKKLRGRETIMVDEQLARWRKKLKKKGLVTGPHQAADRRREAARKERNKTEAAILKGKKSFFE